MVFMPIVKESESTGNFWGLLRMSECFSGDSGGKAVQMVLGRRLRIGNLLPIWMVFPLLLGLRYRLKLRVRLFFCDCLDLCRPEASLRYL